MSFPGERRVKSPERPCHPLLEQIVNDISLAAQVAEIEIGQPELGLGEKFRAAVASKTCCSHLLLREAIAVLTSLEGSASTLLSPGEQRQRIYQLSREESQRGVGILEERLAQLYEEYHQGGPENWRRFVEAWQVFHASYDHYSGIVAPFPVLFAESTIYLPELRALRVDPVKNTLLQSRLAQAIGVLAQGETWEDFLKRYSDRKNLPPSPSQPISYEPLPTKYPSVSASIHFRSAESKPLDELLKEGLTTPIITLHLPTETFLS